SEARSAARPARTASSALSMPTSSVTSSRSCQRIVVTRKPPRSWRVRTMRRPLVAASTSRRCVSANRRRCSAYASSCSPGISTERSCAITCASSGSAALIASLILPTSGASLLLHDLRAELAQLGLGGPGVLRPQAQGQPLARRAALELGIGELVEHLRLRQLQRAGGLGGLQQVIDDLDQAVVEVLARVAEILVGLLEERVEPLVD